MHLGDYAKVAACNLGDLITGPLLEEDELGSEDRKVRKSHRSTAGNRNSLLAHPREPQQLGPHPSLQLVFGFHCGKKALCSLQFQ